MLVARRKEDQNRAVLDPWTIVHVGAGLAAGLLGVRFWPAVTAAVAYELVEQVLERTEAGAKFFRTSGPEIPANAVADVVVFAVAHQWGEWWNQT